MGLIGAITGVQEASAGREITIVYSSTSERVFSLVFGISLSTSAYLCGKRKNAGWWLVVTILFAILLTGLWGVHAEFARDFWRGLSWIAEGVFLSILIWWWFKQAKHFPRNAENT